MMRSSRVVPRFMLEGLRDLGQNQVIEVDPENLAKMSLDDLITLMQTLGIATQDLETKSKAITTLMQNVVSIRDKA